MSKFNYSKRSLETEWNLQDQIYDYKMILFNKILSYSAIIVSTLIFIPMMLINLSKPAFNLIYLPIILLYLIFFENLTIMNSIIAFTLIGYFIYRLFVVNHKKYAKINMKVKNPSTLGQKGVAIEILLSGSIFATILIIQAGSFSKPKMVYETYVQARPFALILNLFCTFISFYKMYYSVRQFLNSLSRFLLIVACLMTVVNDFYNIWFRIEEKISTSKDLRHIRVILSTLKNKIDN